MSIYLFSTLYKIITNISKKLRKHVKFIYLTMSNSKFAEAQLKKWGWNEGF